MPRLPRAAPPSDARLQSGHGGERAERHAAAEEAAPRNPVGNDLDFLAVQPFADLTHVSVLQRFRKPRSPHRRFDRSIYQ